MGYIAITFFFGSMITFMKDIEPSVTKKVLNPAQIKQRIATIRRRMKMSIWRILNKPIIAAPKTIGNMQYPKTHTHWKKLILPPKSLVLIVTTKEPPHITRNTTPNSFPFDFRVILRMLNWIQNTMTKQGRVAKVPKDPLYNNKSTVSELSYSLWITFHVEFRDNDIPEFDANVFHVPPLL